MARIKEQVGYQKACQLLLEQLDNLNVAELQDHIGPAGKEEEQSTLKARQANGWDKASVRGTSWSQSEVHGEHS